MLRVERARQPHDQSDVALAFEREIGQHVAHQRLVRQQTAESAALARVVNGLSHALAHEARGGDRIVEPGVDPHFQYRRDTPTFLSYEQPVSRLEFHFARGVGMVSELVLQALQTQRVDAAVGNEARHEETRQTGGRLCEHQEGIAHRSREEPFVSGEAIFAARPASAGGHGARRVGTHVRAALLLRHAHAHERALLVGGRDESRVVLP